MKTINIGCVISILCMCLSAAPAVAGDALKLDQAVKAVIGVLPPGWTVADVKSNEIPYAHHWDENYTGPKGIQLIVKGTRPVYEKYFDTNGNRQMVYVATEALEIWIMPGNYHNSFSSWISFTRPILPTVVIAHGPIKVYAKPSCVLLSEKDFYDFLHKAGDAGGYDFGIDPPNSLTWKDWRLKLRKVVEKINSTSQP
jgi:hypothetical protein